jgi:predicted HTH domain antitoxin
MTIELSDDHLIGVRVTPDRLKLEAAIGFYSSGDVTLGRAALLAGISQTQLLHELGKRNICINHDVEDLEEDLRTLETLHDCREN